MPQVAGTPAWGWACSSVRSWPGRTVGASRSRPRRERERHSPCGCRCWRRATGLTHSAPLLDCRPTLSRRRPRETPARREAPGAGGGRGRLRPNQSHRPCAGRFVHPCDGRMNKTASTPVSVEIGRVPDVTCATHRADASSQTRMPTLSTEPGSSRTARSARGASSSVTIGSSTACRLPRQKSSAQASWARGSSHSG